MKNINEKKKKMKMENESNDFFSLFYFKVFNILPENKKKKKENRKGNLFTKINMNLFLLLFIIIFACIKLSSLFLPPLFQHFFFIPWVFYFLIFFWWFKFVGKFLHQSPVFLILLKRNKTFLPLLFNPLLNVYEYLHGTRRN